MQNNNVVICKICGENFDNFGVAFSWHIKTHKISLKEYYDRYIEPDTMHVCKHVSCANMVEFLSLQHGYRDYCSSKCSNSSVEVKKKQQASCFKNFGCVHALQSPELLEKSKATCFKNYGVINPQQSYELKEKAKVTCLEKYGVDSPNKSEFVKKKKADSCFVHYGVENPSQSIEVYIKKLKTSFKKKEYKMPSGLVFNVQGYEPYFIDELLKRYDETDIVIGGSEMPIIWYMFEGKKRRYFPDVYVKSINTLFEVKSDYTYKANLYMNIAKQQGSIEAGYNFEFIVYDREMNKVTI